MYSFKNIIQISLLLLTILISNVSFANSNSSIPVSDCGVESSSNTVKIFNGEICEQDLSFRMLYKMFPTVIENFVFPIINPKYLNIVKDLEEENLYIYQTQELIFFEIFKATNNISIFIAAIFVIWHFVIIGLIRSANEGSFLGESWSPAKILFKYGSVVILLLPVSDTGILVIHVLLLSVLIIGIYFANYFWGVYLNYLQIGEDSVNINNIEGSIVEQKADRKEEFQNNLLNYDHNYFLAYSYAKELSKIELCKSRTEKLLVQSVLPLMTEFNYSDIKACLINNNNDPSWAQNLIDNQGVNGFAHYTNQKGSFDLSKSGGAFYTTSNIFFGNKDFKQCQKNQNNDFTAVDYNCGSIKISTPELPNGNIRLAVENSNFYEEYVSASKSVMEKEDPSDDVKNAWTSVNNKIETLFENDSILSGYKHNKGQIIKSVSYYFHQLLMNTALVGSSNYTKESTYGLAPQKNMMQSSFNIAFEEKASSYNKADNFNLMISDYLNDAKLVSDQIEKIGCLKNNKLYSNAKKAKLLMESFENKSIIDKTDFNTSCLDVETLELIGIDPKIYLNADETNKDILNGKLKKEVDDAASIGVENLLALTNKIRLKRNAVEKSYFISIVNSPSNSLVNKLRKDGWAVSGGYMLKLLSEKELDNKISMSLQNSSVAQSANLSIKMLPDLDYKKIIDVDDQLEIKDWFSLIEPMDMVFGNASIKPTRKDLKYVNGEDFVKDRIFDSFNDADFDASGKEDFYDLLFNLEIIENLKSVVGIDSTGELSIEQIEACLERDNEKGLKCPINLTNPILEITQLGHSLINIATKIIAVAISLAVLELSVLRGLNSKNKENNKGSADGTAKETVKQNENVDDNAKAKIKNDENAKRSKVKAAKSGMFYIFEKGSLFLQYFMKIAIGMASFLLTVGFTLAYVIPLIPFIAFTIAFISWIVISLEILVIATIWLAFLFRIEDKNKASTELYMAGFNFIMQMLFRPSLIVISITIGWSLFSVIFMAINFTIGTFISEFSNSGILLSVVYGLLIIIAYALIIYVSIKKVFDLMIMLPNKIFNKVGVQPLDSSYESNAKDTLSNFTMAGIGGSALLSRGIYKNIDENLKERKEIKETGLRETLELRKQTNSNLGDDIKDKEKEKNEVDKKIDKKDDEA